MALLLSAMVKKLKLVLSDSDRRGNKDGVCMRERRLQAGCRLFNLVLIIMENMYFLHRNAITGLILLRLKLISSD